MKNRAVLKIVICVIAVLAIALIFKYSTGGKSTAQAPQISQMMGGRPQGGGGMRAGFQREHKYMAQLMRTFMSIGRLEGGGKDALTKEQAKEVLAVIAPLTKEDEVSESDARDAAVRLQDILTEKQRAVISAMPEERGPGRGGPGGRMNGGGMPPMGGRPGMGGPGIPSPSPGMTPQRAFNPFNPPNLGQGGEQRPDRVTQIIDALKKKAGSK